MLKKTLVLILVGTLFVACDNSESKNSKSEKESTTAEKSSEEHKEPENPNVFISGVLKNGKNRTLVLEGNINEKIDILGKTETDANGKFKIKAAINEIGLYQLRLVESVAREEQQKLIPLTLLPNDEIYLELDAEDYNFSVQYKGTDWAKSLDGFMVELNDFVEWQESLVNPELMDREELIKLFINKRKNLENYIIGEINKAPDNPANMILMSHLMPMVGFDNYDAKYIDILKKMKNAYGESYAGSQVALGVTAEIEQLEQGWNDYEVYVVKNEAPEIALPNPEGQEMTLSSLRGNYVLIDFWAAWCPPCRAENPNVVRLYEKYKNKNFKIFSVSLDDNAEDWKRAIKDDGLIWEHHVSDLKKWNSPLVQRYQFSGIPHTVFIDPNGKIIAKNLRGITLERKLQELFGK